MEIKLWNRTHCCPAGTVTIDKNQIKDIEERHFLNPDKTNRPGCVVTMNDGLKYDSIETKVTITGSGPSLFDRKQEQKDKQDQATSA